MADRAVDVGDCAARTAHEMVVVVSDPPLEPGRAAGRFYAADETAAVSACSASYTACREM